MTSRAECARRVGQRDVAEQPAAARDQRRRRALSLAESCRRARDGDRSTPRDASSRGLPTSDRLAVHVASAPWPGTALNAVTGGALRPRADGLLRDHAADRMLAVAVHRRRQPQHVVGAARRRPATTSATTGVPRVSVPVLSNARLRTAASRSRCAPPLMRTPRRAPAASADTTATGVAITSAHGQAITSSTSAR